jgi:acyl-CoA synthetase (AMP-forming)/AMP-acid ligase II
LGSLDENGYLRIAGRIKDMIIRGGQNIYPAELEDVLTNHPKIHRAAVVGVPDDIAGERVVAFVIPYEGENLHQVEILDHCRKNMAPFKVPSEVRLVEEFPLNAMGKVLKRQLREDIIAEMNHSLLFTPTFWETAISKTKNLFLNNP